MNGEKEVLNVDQELDNPTPAGHRQNRFGFILEFVRFAVIAAAIVIPIRLYVASPFIVSGASMEPTFDTGHYLIIDEISYRFQEPARGEVVVFKYPNDPSKYFIKRIIGLPGETVSLNRGAVTIKNKEYPDGVIIKEPYLQFHSSETLAKTLRDDEYFVMGDNRPASSDSRVWGALPRDYITGRALVRILPPTKLELFPGRAITQ